MSYNWSYNRYMEKNLERQAELEECNLDSDLVDPAFAVKDLDEYEKNLYGERLSWLTL